MKQDRALLKLQDLLEKDFQQLQHNLMWKDGNEYYLFNRYCIRKTTNGVTVYKYGTEINGFWSLRSAVSWCIADKYNQILLGQEIFTLDQEKAMLTNDIQVRTALYRKMKPTDLREAVGLKLDTRNLRLRTITDRLDKCVNLAKYWQIRGFNNETARTGRTASSRTSN